jgi:hypothetical protein
VIVMTGVDKLQEGSKVNAQIPSGNSSPNPSPSPSQDPSKNSGATRPKGN